MRHPRGEEIISLKLKDMYCKQNVLRQVRVDTGGGGSSFPSLIECGGLQCEHSTGIFVVFNRLSHRTRCLDLGIVRVCMTTDCVNDNTQEGTQ